MSSSIRKTINIFTLPSGKSPFSDWLDSLKDRITRARINRKTILV